MKKYRVVVNGVAYEVELEAMDSQSAASAPAVAKAQEPAATVAPAPVASAPAGGEKIVSPMPGTILAVNISNGQSVKRGDVLFILEAMKMENEILAPSDGTVSALSVTKGQSVETGALLCAIA